MTVAMFGGLRRAAGSMRARLAHGSREQAEREERIARVAEVIEVGSPIERGWIINEVAGDLCYERGGVRVEPGDTVIDVGANVGVAAAHFAINRSAGVVHSFEPVRETFEALQGNVRSLPACHPHQIGLASRAGRRKMTIYPGDSVLATIDPDEARVRRQLAQVAENWGVDRLEAEDSMSGRLEGEVIECDFIRLSDFITENGLGPIDLLKVDVERAELEVLDGIDDEHWPLVRQVTAELHAEELERNVVRLLRAKGFRVTVEQEEALVGTPVEILYAIRSDSRPER